LIPKSEFIALFYMPITVWIGKFFGKTDVKSSFSTVNGMYVTQVGLLV